MNDIEFVYDGVHIPSVNTFIVADLHLGKQIQTPFGPPTVTTGKTREKLLTALTDISPEHVVLAGDTFHYVNPSEEAVNVVKTIAEHVSKVTLLVGNHEDIPENIPHIHKKATVKEEIKIQETVIFHGHKTPTTTGNRFILGHLHPFVEHDGTIDAAYLLTETYGNLTIVLPAFTDAAGENPIQGTTIGNICPVLSKAEDIQYLVANASKRRQTESDFLPVPERT